MIKKIILIFVLSTSINTLFAQNNNQVDYSKLSGLYLGQKTPKMLPEIFAPFITSPKDEKFSAPIFTPNGKEILFSAYIKRKYPQKVLRIIKKNEKWSKPQEMSFSKKYQIGGPVMSANGNRVYFYSKKPLNGLKERETSIIYYSDKIENSWSELKLLKYGYNDSLFYIPTSISNANELYFEIGNDDSSSIYMGLIENDSLINVKKLPHSINKQGFNNSLAVLSPDETTIIFWRFSSQDMEKTGLYISLKNVDGNWSEGRHMGDMINTGDSRFPGFSSDGKYFFFMSSINGRAEIYWVDAKIIDFLKTDDLNLTDKLYSKCITINNDEIQEYYELLKHKYNEYYRFDGKLLKRVTDKLFETNRTVKAAKLIRLNLLFFPSNQPVTQHLFLSILENNRKTYRIEIDKLKKKKGKTHGNLEFDVNRLGNKLFKIKKFEEGINIFKTNTKLFPQSASTYKSLGEAYKQKGDMKKAKKSFKKALKLAPNNEDIKKAVKELKKVS